MFEIISTEIDFFISKKKINVENNFSYLRLKIRTEIEFFISS